MKLAAGDKVRIIVKDNMICMQKIEELDLQIKQKLGFPSNSTIRLEKVKWSKYCEHEHKYYYAYLWDCDKKKLKKKYIGKELPLDILLH